LSCASASPAPWCMPLGFAWSSEYAIERMINPPAVRRPATEMPNARSNSVPKSRHRIKMTATANAAVAAILDRCAPDFPSVIDRKIGMFPMGFMMAKRAANALAISPQSIPFPSLTLSIFLPLHRMPAPHPLRGRN